MDVNGSLAKRSVRPHHGRVGANAEARPADLAPVEDRPSVRDVPRLVRSALRGVAAGQTVLSNHAVADSSVGNTSINLTMVRPSRGLSPGAVEASSDSIRLWP